MRGAAAVGTGPGPGLRGGPPRPLWRRPPSGYGASPGRLGEGEAARSRLGFGGFVGMGLCPPGGAAPRPLCLKAPPVPTQRPQGLAPGLQPWARSRGWELCCENKG